MNKNNIKLNKLLSNSENGLIVGNGFSINFDSSYSDIYGSLKNGKDTLIRKGIFEISPGAKLITKKKVKENYYSVINFVKGMEQKQLEQIFEDALKFAAFIVETPKIIELLLNSKHLHKLKGSPDMLSITRNINKLGKEKGFKAINIENWPVLVWIYNLIDQTPEFIEYSKSPNLFITLLKLGEKVQITDPNLPGSVMSRTRFNGFSIFYRLLMISIVFNKGKSVGLNKLSNISNINIQKLQNWLEHYSILFSLNYDLILDKISQRDVVHLHGKYTSVKQGYTLYHSFTLPTEEDIYYTNNILLGDYLTAKVLDLGIHQLVLKNQLLTEPLSDPLTLLSDSLKGSKINHIVFFGVHPENDYHILSGIYFYFFTNKIPFPQISYCYYNESEISDFKNTWQSVINEIYSKTINYAENITINFVDSKELINKVFY